MERKQLTFILKEYFKQSEQYGRNQEDWKKGTLEKQETALKRNQGMSWSKAVSLEGYWVS